MKIRGIRVKQGIKIKAVGLTEKERKIFGDAIKKALRRVQYERKKGDHPSLPYSYDLKAD